MAMFLRHVVDPQHAGVAVGVALRRDQRHLVLAVMVDHAVLRDAEEELLDVVPLVEALERCKCKIDYKKVSAFMYLMSGVRERKGHIPAAVEFSFIDPNANPTDKSTVITADPKAPWSRVSESALPTLRRSGPFITSETGAELSDDMLAARREQKRPTQCGASS